MEDGRTILGKSIDHTRSIELGYTDNVISFEFSALHYANPKKNQYAYKMEGVDKDWIFTGADKKFVNYTNLPRGRELVFRVKSANNDGLWNSNEQVIIIYVHPPFWETWWFRILVISSILLIVIIGVRTRINALKKQKIKLENTVQERTLELRGANIEIKRQKNDLEVQYLSLQLLLDIGKDISSSLNVEDIVEKLYSSINKLIDTPFFFLGMKNQNEESMELWGYLNSKGDLQYSNIELIDYDILTSWCIKNKKPIFIKNLSEEIIKYQNSNPSEYLKLNKYKTLMYFPLVSMENRLIGVMILKSFQKDAYNNSHFELLKNMSIYIAIALDNASAYKEIKQYSQKLEEIDEAKTLFFTNISHEFRTPLTLILGPLREILKTPLENNPISGQIKIAEKNANRLLKLINQILDIASIESGKMELKVSRLNLYGIIKNIVELYEYLASSKKIRLVIKPDLDLANPKFGYIDKDKIENPITIIEDV